jgi:hypothetical protein
MSTPIFPKPAESLASTGHLRDARHDFNVVFIHSRLDDYGLTPPQFRVIAHLARRAGSGDAYPAVKSIARVCCLHPQTVRRALRFLFEQKLITRQSRPGRTPIYRLTPAAYWLPSPRIVGYPSDLNTPPSDSEDTPTKQAPVPPYETNIAEGNPLEGNPTKANTHTTQEPVSLPLSETQAVEAAKLLAIPEEFARNEFNSRAAVGWVNGAGIAIRSWPHNLKKRWTDEQGQRAERAARPSNGSSRPSGPPRQFKPADY